MTKPLTKKQQELIELNHNLIYKFASINNLLIEEYYDILAIGMCKAASIFNEEKGAFSTVAFRCMRNEVMHYWRYMQKKSAIPNEKLLYYDKYMHGQCGDFSENSNFLSIFSDNNYTHEIAIGNMMVETFIDLLTQKEKDTVKLLMKGLTQSEIAKKTNSSRQNISVRVMNIHKKLDTFLENN